MKAYGLNCMKCAEILWFWVQDLRIEDPSLNPKPYRVT